jgi:hypothetical protein
MAAFEMGDPMVFLSVLPVDNNDSMQQLSLLGARGSAFGQLFEALRYKPEGRVFDSRWCHWNFSTVLWPWGRLSLSEK